MTTLNQRLGDICNATCVGIALALSKDLGVLQVLLDAQQPLTSQEIADMKDMKERYIREMLNCLATAEVIRVSTNKEGTLVYHIEENEKHAFKSPEAAFVSFPTLAVGVYKPVKSCFPTSGPYCVRFSDITNVSVSNFTTCFQDNNVQSILKFVDGLKERLESGIDVIEFGCGKGGMISIFAQTFPKSTFTASEVSPSLIEELKVTLGHIPNIKFQIDDFSSLPNPPVKQYDWVYCTYVIHCMPYPLQTLQSIHKLIKKPHGIFTMIEFATSGSPIIDKGKMSVACFYAGSTFVAIPESYQKEDSQTLGPCWGKQTAINLATKAGFTVQSVDILDQHALHICRP